MNENAGYASARSGRTDIGGPGQPIQVGCASIGPDSALLEIMCQTSSDMKEVKHAVENIMCTLFGPEPCNEEPKDFSSEPSVRSEAWESYRTTQQTLELLRIIRDRLVS